MQLRWLRYGFQAAAVTALGCGFLSGCGDDSNEGGAGGNAAGPTTDAASTSGTPSSNTANSSSSGQQASSSTGMALLVNGDNCAMDAQCDSGFCLTEANSGWAQGYCTDACNALVPCADPDSSCVDIGVQVCLKNCTLPAGSRCTGAGQACSDLGSGVAACVGGCVMDSDCATACDNDNSLCGDQENCSNGTDDDGDLLADCEENDCTADATCGPLVSGACTGAIDISAGGTFSGSTSTGSNSFANLCQDIFGDSSVVGHGTHEQIFTFTAPAHGILSLKPVGLDPFDWYVRSTCDDTRTSLGCLTDLASADDPVTLEMDSASTIFVYIDGEADYIMDVDFEPIVCGDGNLGSGEECDDGNTTAGDGCDATCHTEFDFYCNAATPISLGTTNGNNTTGSNVFDAPTDSAQCTFGAGDSGNESLYVYTPATSGMLTVALDPGTVDMGIYARTTCDDVASQVGCADENFMTVQTESMTIPVTAAVPVTIFVDAYQSAGGPFTLTLTQP